MTEWPSCACTKSLTLLGGAFCSLFPPMKCDAILCFACHALLAVLTSEDLRDVPLTPLTVGAMVWRGQGLAHATKNRFWPENWCWDQTGRGIVVGTREDREEEKETGGTPMNTVPLSPKQRPNDYPR